MAARRVKDIEYELLRSDERKTADIVIEREKDKLKSGTPAERSAAYRTLTTILIESITMLHPFVPFVTEAVYQEILSPTGPVRDKNLPEFLMIRRWD